MKRYYVGDRLILGERGGISVVPGRVEALRPDGTAVTRDWENGPWRLKLDQPGMWTWRLYIRDGARTLLEEGEVEVLPAVTAPGILQRLLRRRS